MEFTETISSLIEEATTTDDEETNAETVETAAPQAETTETSTDNATETATEQPTTTEPQKIKVRYNHEDRELTLEEAIVFAQKGMLYDDEGVAETMKQIKELAKANGFSSNKEYMQQVSKSLRETQVHKLSEEEGIPESVAQQIISKDERIRELEQAQTARSEHEENRKKIFAEIDELQQMYPNVEIKNIPMSVYEAKSKRPDVPLAYHYAHFLEVEQRNAEDVRKKAAENAQSSTGSLRNNSTDTVNEVDEIINRIFK